MPTYSINNSFLVNPPDSWNPTLHGWRLLVLSVYSIDPGNSPTKRLQLFTLPPLICPCFSSRAPAGVSRVDRRRVPTRAAGSWSRYCSSIVDTRKKLKNPDCEAHLFTSISRDSDTSWSFTALYAAAAEGGRMCAQHRPSVRCGTLRQAASCRADESSIEASSRPRPPHYDLRKFKIYHVWRQQKKANSNRFLS